METMEIIGLLMFTIIVAGMVLTFIFGINFGSIQEQITNVFVPKNDVTKFQEATVLQLLSRIDSCWQQCEFGAIDTDCSGLYVTTDGLTAADKTLFTTTGITSATIGDKLSKLNFCSSCNISISTAIKLPSIVKVSCTTSGKNIILTQ